MSKHHDARSVLVVDDDLEIREALRDVLEDAGHSVALAANGTLALEYLETHENPRVILLDMMMPGLDGWGFRAKQLSEPAIAKVPVVVMSASAYVAKSGGFEADGYIQKPFKLEQLLEVLDRFGDGESS